MNISKLTVTVELTMDEIWDIIFPLAHEIKRNAEHYIKHYSGKDEDIFIKYVLENSHNTFSMLKQFSSMVARLDLIESANIDIKEVFRNKHEETP